MSTRIGEEWLFIARLSLALGPEEVADQVSVSDA
jgi:hypothetical protein